MSGKGGRNLDWSSMALVLVDVQTDFYTPRVASQFPEFDKRAFSLIDTCRGAGLEVVHLRSRFIENDTAFLPMPTKHHHLPCREGTTGERPLPWAVETDSERVFYKQSWDGFLNPEFGWYLEAREKHVLFFAGLITTVCIFFTASGAAQRGYVPVLVTDCCAATSVERQETAVAEYRGLVFDTVESGHLTERYHTWADYTSLLDG